MANAEFLRKMQSVYGGNSLNRDIFGSRPAMPSEIKAQLEANQSSDFRELEPLHLPTEKDLEEKGEKPASSGA